MPFTKTFHGFIENITDTLLIIEACRNGLLPTINRRLIERERSAIKSGTIIVFDESESGIKRWTDGFLWSPSRILGNFLVYRELANRENRNSDGDDDDDDLTNKGGDSNMVLLHQRERALVGSLTTANTTYNFKKHGLIKKTIRILVNGNYLHIVSYYNKNDVLENLLPTPSASPQLACLQISADLMPHLQGLSPSQSIPSLLSSSSSSSTSCSVRKRSRSYDEQPMLYHHRQRQRSCQQPPQQKRYPYPMYDHHTTTTTTTMLPPQPMDYPTPFYNTYKAPFTELPLPLPSLSDYHQMTTNSNGGKGNKYHPSPSPTPSPPTTLPRVNTDRSSYTFNHVFDHSKSTTLDNY